MKVADNIGVTFVNTVVNRGIFNDIVNLNLGVFNFTPAEDNTIDFDPVINCRLRMDMACAEQLRNTLDTLLQQAAQMKASPQPEEKHEEVASKPSKKRVAVN